jgi:hypothetical protein
LTKNINVESRWLKVHTRPYAFIIAAAYVDGHEGIIEISDYAVVVYVRWLMKD